jgi:DsbC/DsbD-like thiol-disulfide interchange protein
LEGRIEGQNDANRTRAGVEEVLVTTSVRLEHAGATPGGTVWAAVRFEIKPGWHIYWPGQNDTGAVTEISVNGPPGLRAGPVRWPPPQRYVSPGDILDHVYTEMVTALVPVTLPTDATVGETVELSFDLSWVACEEVCIFGEETVRVSLAVVERAPGVDQADRVDPATVLTTAELFAAARARLPEPADAFDRIAKIHWENNTAVIRARGAHALAFYPGDGGLRVDDLMGCGVSTGDTLRLPVSTPAGAGSGGRKAKVAGLSLEGLLEVFSPDGISRVYEVKSVRPAR